MSRLNQWGLAALVATAAATFASAARAAGDEIRCTEVGSDGDRYLTAEVKQGPGSLIAEVTQHEGGNARLAQRVGVGRRDEPGHDLDVFYGGPDFRLMLSSRTLDGILEATVSGQARRVSVHCEQ